MLVYRGPGSRVDGRSMIDGGSVSDFGSQHTVFGNYETATTGPRKRICIGGNSGGEKTWLPAQRDGAEPRAGRRAHSPSTSRSGAPSRRR